MGISLTMYARLEEADPLVTSLSTDKDPVLRRSGMYTIAMAYCGTGNNQAIRKLLHVAVSMINRCFMVFWGTHPMSAPEAFICLSTKISSKGFFIV